MSYSRHLGYPVPIMKVAFTNLGESPMFAIRHLLGVPPFILFDTLRYEVGGVFLRHSDTSPDGTAEVMITTCLLLVAPVEAVPYGCPFGYRSERDPCT